MDTTLVPRAILQKAFPGLSKEEAGEIIKKGQVRTFLPDDLICKEGAFESTFYIILSGEVRVSKVINETEEKVLKFLHTGDFFGEMAIIHNAARAASISTSQATTVLEFSKEVFSALLEKSSAVSMAMVREVSKRLRENDNMAIEDLRDKARELADAYQQLAEMEFARSQFLTTIAHELRTPLMAANGFVEVMRSGGLQGEALQSGLETVARNLQQIIALTNDILFLQEMDLILPEFQPVDLGSIVAAAVERMRAKAATQGIGMALLIAPDLPTIPGDGRSLERAVSAILDNAIKFSPDGGDVMVEVKRQGEGVWITISDKGVGIPESALPKIFDRFFHLDEVNGRLFRGVGLGLSITEQVVAQHHGRISAESKLGSGSKFSIRFNC